MKERHYDPLEGGVREQVVIIGDLQASSFIPWIRRHAAKLGISQSITHVSAERIELEVEGAQELLDMMEMGCSLGPIDVWVEAIERREIAARPAN
ncbi:acylphosphatase [Pararhizobium sp. DWP1-1-3]|uniref:acylphosphatase n=1 Tax=Pararhizobium sp. DWP1-1-3 TaxID=2804652 RepID=UPI003CE6CE2C